MEQIKSISGRIPGKDFTQANREVLLLYHGYKDILNPILEFNIFWKLYHSEKLVEINYTLFYSGEKTVGFSAAFFYSVLIKGKPCYIARAATGLSEDKQGKRLHDKINLYSKFVRFKLRHPFKPLVVTAFVINPLLFAELCKYIPRIYPGSGKDIPEHFIQLKDEFSESSDPENDILHPNSAKVLFQVEFNETLLKRIFGSEDAAVKWFCKENPYFLNQYGLRVIIPVTMSNILGTCLNLTKDFYRKKWLPKESYVRQIGQSPRLLNK